MPSSARAEIDRVPVTILRPVSITHILMKLHFEHLHRERQTAFCRGDSGVRPDYVSTGVHERLIKSDYGRNND